MNHNISRSALDLKKQAVVIGLRECASVVVALSGGVDSAVLLALALEAVGKDRVLAVTGQSPSLPAADLEAARLVARTLGARHQLVRTRELEREGYVANAGDRCFHCRTELFEALIDLARRLGFRRVAYGAITDDMGDVRPGMRAAEQHGVLAPLLEAGLDKREVRELAVQAGLPVHDKPASACLSSRIPIGTRVTTERLVQVERAETALRELGFRQFRVRHHEQVARLELDADGERHLALPGVRARVVQVLREAGYLFVALDLEGYRTGSLNRLTATVQRIGPAREAGQ